MARMKSVQETFGPAGICFGCGPANPQGLRIRSFEEGDELVADWTPQPHHQAFENVLNGGICVLRMDISFHMGHRAATLAGEIFEGLTPIAKNRIYAGLTPI